MRSNLHISSLSLAESKKNTPGKCPIKRKHQPTWPTSNIRRDQTSWPKPGYLKGLKGPPAIKSCPLHLEGYPTESTEAKPFFFCVSDSWINYLSFHVLTRLQRSLLVPYLSNKLSSGDAQSVFLFFHFWGHLTKGAIGLLPQQSIHSPCPKGYHLLPRGCKTLLYYILYSMEK